MDELQCFPSPTVKTFLIILNPMFERPDGLNSSGVSSMKPSEMIRGSSFDDFKGCFFRCDDLSGAAAEWGCRQNSKLYLASVQTTAQTVTVSELCAVHASCCSCCRNSALCFLIVWREIRLWGESGDRSLIIHFNALIFTELIEDLSQQRGSRSVHNLIIGVLSCSREWEEHKHSLMEGCGWLAGRALENVWLMEHLHTSPSGELSFKVCLQAEASWCHWEPPRCFQEYAPSAPGGCQCWVWWNLVAVVAKCLTPVSVHLVISAYICFCLILPPHY